MLSVQKQPKYLKKRIQLPNGSWALVVFELVEVNGKTIAKAVYGELLEQKVEAKETILSLPVYFEKQSVTPVVSPFFSYVSSLLKDLSFTTSQSTRAPNFI